jgi:hypothetical protein
MNFSTNVFWSYEIDERVLVLESPEHQDFEQDERGYRIYKRVKLLGAPAYHLSGAFFPHRENNLFLESELMSISIFKELTSEWILPDDQIITLLTAVVPETSTTSEITTATTATTTATTVHLRRSARIQKRISNNLNSQNK